MVGLLWIIWLTESGIHRFQIRVNIYYPFRKKISSQINLMQTFIPVWASCSDTVRVRYCKIKQGQLFNRITEQLSSGINSENCTETVTAQICVVNFFSGSRSEHSARHSTQAEHFLRINNEFESASYYIHIDMLNCIIQVFTFSHMKHLQTLFYLPCTQKLPFLYIV